MANGTSIEWTAGDDGTAGATWNPIRGCSRITPGCGGPNHQGGCYAEKIAARFSGPGQPFEGFAERTEHGGRWTGKMAVIWDMVDQPIRWRKPRRIFANSMSDLFHENLPRDEVAVIFGTAIAAVHLRGHTIQILTKRADRMRELLHDAAFWEIANAHAEGLVIENVDPLSRRSDDARATCDDYGPDRPPPGIWLGVSVEDQQRADERIPELLKTPAAIRFLSCEPLLGPLNLHPYLLGFPAGHPASCICGHGHGFDRCPNYGKVAKSCHRCDCQQFRKAPGSDGLHLAIIGGESGPKSRAFNVAWARDLVRQCGLAKVPVFVKQLGANPITGDLAHWRCGHEPLPAGAGYRLKLENSKGGDMAEWPEDLRVRELPR